jgi:hypothetical protein
MIWLFLRFRPLQKFHHLKLPSLSIGFGLLSTAPLLAVKYGHIALVLLGASPEK